MGLPSTLDSAMMALMLQVVILGVDRMAAGRRSEKTDSASCMMRYSAATTGVAGGPWQMSLKFIKGFWYHRQLKIVESKTK
jgi:hypothetical protein